MSDDKRVLAVGVYEPLYDDDPDEPMDDDAGSFEVEAIIDPQADGFPPADAVKRVRSAIDKARMGNDQARAAIAAFMEWAVGR